MVEPRQYQLEELDGDCTGPGDNNTVISLTGSGGTVDANGNRITNVGSPAAGTDAVNRDYVDGYSGAGSLAQVLLVGNTTGTEDIVLSSGTTLRSADTTVTINDNLYVNGTLEITGKLTVPGEIDPTSIVFTATTGLASANAIWVDNTTETAFVFNSSDSTEVFRAGKDTETFIGVGANFASSGSYRLGNDKYLVGVDSGSNDAFLLGIDSGNNIIVGDSTGSGEDLNVKIYAEDRVDIIDTNSGSEATRFSFLSNIGTLQFDNSNTNAILVHEDTTGDASSHTLIIRGQTSSSSHAGQLNIAGGVASGGSGDGGSISVIAGTASGSGDGGGITIQSAASTGTGNSGQSVIRGIDCVTSEKFAGSVTLQAGYAPGNVEDGYLGEIVSTVWDKFFSEFRPTFKVTPRGIAAHKHDECRSAGSDITSYAGPYVQHVHGMTRVLYGTNGTAGWQNPDYFLIADIVYNNGYVNFQT